MFNIAYITDENYVLPTKVSLASLIEAVQGEEVLVTIVTDEVSQPSRQSLLDMQTANVRIRLVENYKIATDIAPDHPYISRAGILKFFLPEYIMDADTLLYLDGDTLLFPGFLSIFRTDISDVYAAVVPDMEVMRRYGLHEKIGIPKYFNSGVMLLNLAKMRADGVSSKLVEDIQSRHQTLFMDQDSFNAVFGKAVKYIGLEYNCLDCYAIRYPQKETLDFYGAGLDDLCKPFIRHVTGGIKLWKAPGGYGLREWLEKVDDEDFLKLARSYFETLSKRIDTKAALRPGMLTRPYQFGSDMLLSSTDGVELDGFFNEETWGRWCGAKASIRVSGEEFLKITGDIRLCLKVHSFHAPRVLRLSFNGSELGEFTVPSGEARSRDIIIPRDKVKGANLIEFACGGDSVSPMDLDMGFDTRNLFIGTEFVRITENTQARLASSESRLSGLDSRLAGFDSRLGGFGTRLVGLGQNLGDQGAMIVEMRKSLDEAHAGLRNALAEIAAIHNSTWFKLGRALTYVPRKVKKLFL